MRISTAQFFESTSSTYQNNFSSVIKTQQQIDSGVRIQTAADDPVGAARLLQLQQQKDMLAQYTGNMSSIKAALGSQETVLDSINTALQKASELTLQAGGGALSDADRSTIANELGSIEEQVFSLLNSKDSAGNYMFSGSKTDTPPYARNNDGTYSYQGDDTQLNLKVSDTLTLASTDTAKSIMEGAINTGRTQTLFTPVLGSDGSPSTNNGEVMVSAGLLTSTADYSKEFSANQPYSLKFLSSTEYELTGAGDNPVTVRGNFDASTEAGKRINVGGVSFDINLNLKDIPVAEQDAAVAKYAFTLEVKPDTASGSNQTQSALDTISQLRKALVIPSDKDPVAYQTQRDAINTAIGNLKNASTGIDSARGSIGARLQAVDIQTDENVSMGLASDSTIAAIGNTDLAGASIELALQKSMLEASQLAFVKISQLSLFNQL